MDIDTLNQLINDLESNGNLNSEKTEYLNYLKNLREKINQNSQISSDWSIWWFDNTNIENWNQAIEIQTHNSRFDNLFWWFSGDSTDKINNSSWDSSWYDCQDTAWWCDWGWDWWWWWD